MRTWSVDVRLIRFVEKGTSNIAGAVAEEEDCVGDDLLGVSCIMEVRHGINPAEKKTYLLCLQSAYSRQVQMRHYTAPSDNSKSIVQYDAG